MTNFHNACLLHPNFDALASDIRLYHDMGVKGIFFQGLAIKGMSFDELHSYAQSRLAWNPSRDYWVEATEFIHAFYGAAGPAIRDFVEVMHENIRQGFHIDLATHPHFGIFTDAQIQKMRQCLKKAISAADGEAAIQGRLEFVKLWMDYTQYFSITPMRKGKIGIPCQRGERSR